MDFALSDEQRMLSESLTRFIAERYDFHQRLNFMAQPEGFSRVIWGELAELGVLALPFSEDDGGFAGGGVETMVVMEVLGRGLVVEPYLATVVLAGGALRLAASNEQKARRIAGIGAGDYIIALAHHERDGLRHTTAYFRTRAEPVAGGWRLDGAKTAVMAGAVADELVVSAITPNGVSLFLVERAAAGVKVTDSVGYDGVKAADISFTNVHVTAKALLGEDGQGDAILTCLFEEANAALCAEAVGIMEDVLHSTIDYLKTRTQFGVAIGTFQALQHRCVDMLMQVELARSMAILAALSLTRDSEARRLDIAAAKVQVCRAARLVGQEAIQMHGAIGLTMELKVGHAFKRLTAISAMFGDVDHHLEAIADAGGLAPLA